MVRKISNPLTDTKHPWYFAVSDILALVTVLSIVGIVLETMPRLQQYSFWFSSIEIVTVIIFSLEYFLRILYAKKKASYIFSVLGLIDLMSILPSILGLGNLTFLKSARAIRLIRLLRMIRLAKLKNFHGDDVDGDLSFFSVNIALFCTVTIVSTLFVGTLIYLIEGDSESFASIPAGMLWSFKVFLMGLPVSYPETTGGQLVHLVARLVGLIVFGVLVGVAGNILKEYLFTKRRKS